MKDKLVKVIWEGTTPLVMQKICKEQLVKSSRKRKPEDMPIEDMLYREKDSPVYTFPSRNILSCIRDGAARTIERNRTTYKNTILGFVSITEDRVPLLNLKGKPFDATKNEGWEAWERPLTRSNGEKIWAMSPMFKEWRIDFDLVVCTDYISVDVVTEIMEAAGKLFGFGSSISIGYGRFKVKV